MKISHLIKLILIIVLGLGSLTAIASIEEEIQIRLRSGEYQTALKLIDSELQKNQNNRQLLLARGYTLMKLNRLDEATRYYERLRVLLKDDPEPGNNLAMVYRLQKNYALAITMFSETIRNFPQFTPAYINLGDTYIEIAKNQYQRGFTATGDIMLQQKAALSREFDQIAAQSIARQINQTPPPPPPIEQTIAPVNQAEEKPRTEAEITQEIIQALKAWVSDWMSLEPEGYFSHYSKEFVPEKGISTDAWMKRKRGVLSRSKFIKVYITDIDIKLAQDDSETATIVFNQRYQSDTFNSISRKKLVLKQENDQWLIINEYNLKP